MKLHLDEWLYRTVLVLIVIWFALFGFKDGFIFFPLRVSGRVLKWLVSC